MGIAHCMVALHTSPHVERVCKKKKANKTLSVADVSPGSQLNAL